MEKNKSEIHTQAKQTNLMGLHKVISILLEKGFEVFKNVNDFYGSDLIVKYGNQLIPISVKTSYHTNPKSTSRNFRPGKLETSTKFIIGVADKDYYIIPKAAIDTITIQIYDRPGSSCKYNKYKNHWDLLKRKRIRIKRGS